MFLIKPLSPLTPGLIAPSSTYKLELRSTRDTYVQYITHYIIARKLKIPTSNIERQKKIYRQKNT